MCHICIYVRYVRVVEGIYIYVSQTMYVSWRGIYIYIYVVTDQSWGRSLRIELISRATDTSVARWGGNKEACITYYLHIKSRRMRRVWIQSPLWWGEFPAINKWQIFDFSSCFPWSTSYKYVQFQNIWLNTMITVLFLSSVVSINSF